MRMRIRNKFNFHPRKIRITELVLIILVLFSGVTLGFTSGGFVINFGKVGFNVISSLQKGTHAVTSFFENTVTSIKETAELRKQYKLLVNKLKDYEYMQRNNTEIRKENERLKEQLDFAQTLTQKNYAAEIIARDPESQYSGITINKGSRNGIKKGMPVIAIQKGNVGIVGKIVTVGIGTSMIMPLYDVHCNISARIQSTRDIGIVRGNGSVDNLLSMIYIKKRVLDELNYGDIIVTSGENGNYMSDIPIGTITKLTAINYDSSLQIELTPIIDFSRLETVFVVDQTANNESIQEEAQ